MSKKVESSKVEEAVTGTVEEATKIDAVDVTKSATKLQTLKTFASKHQTAIIVGGAAVLTVGLLALYHDPKLEEQIVENLSDVQE